MDERLKKQFDFIQRQTLLTGGERKENDAEHAWHMALMTVLLSEYSNEKIDVLKTVTMLLLHDIVEIDAGDTYCYDEEGKKTQHERELKAAERIFGLLPDDQYEIENAETPEAKFARPMDNVQPVMLNDATDGKMWAERKIKLSQVLGRQKKTPKGSQILAEYSFDNFIKPNVDKGRLIDDTQKDS